MKGYVAPSPTFTPSPESSQKIGENKEGAGGNPVPLTGSRQAPQDQEASKRVTQSITQPATASPPPTSARGVTPARNTPSSQPTTPVPTLPGQGGQVVVGGLGRPDTLHPLLAESEASRSLLPLIFDSLLTRDPDTGQLIPHLAESWAVANDSRTITFTLRTDVRWHDGRPVTADDVIFSVEAARDPDLDSLYGPQLEHVIEVKAPDNRTIVTSLNEAHCPSVGVLGELPIIPRHVLVSSDPGPALFGKAPLGSGPFLFIDWTPEGEVNLARNEDYWGKVPYLDALIYYPFETSAELGDALAREEIDLALMPSGQLQASADPSPGLSSYGFPTPQFLFVAFNNDHPVLGNPQVRLALSMANDREQLLDQVLNGAGELIAASLPATHWAADPALEPPSYDPDRARQLLVEAGWADSDGDGWLDQDGNRLRLPVRTNGGNQLREEVATLVAGYYRAIGVDASVELASWGAIVDDLFTHDFDIIVFSWPLEAEPDQSRWWLSTEGEIGSGYNFVAFADPRVDRLLQEALTVPDCNAGRRAELYQQIQQVLAQERPYDFLFMPYATVLTRPELHGLRAGPFAAPLKSAAAWYLAP